MKRLLPLILVFISLNINSQNIELDTNYGDNGYTYIFSNTTDDATKSARLTDGSIVMSVLKFNTIKNRNVPTIVKYNSNGFLDSNFANNGEYAFDDLDDNGYDIFIDSNDNIYLCASTFDENFIEFGAIFKLFPSGTLDTSFGNNGRKIIDYRCREFYLRNNFIYVAGQSDLANGTTDFIQKMDLNGNFVTYLNTSVSPAINVNEMYVSNNNEVFIVGVEENIGAGTNDSTVIVVKFDIDGNLDTNFANNGILYTFTETNDTVPEYSSFTESSNSIYLGMSYTGSSFFSEIYKYDIANGNLDTGFGNNGYLLKDNFYHTSLELFDDDLYVTGIKVDTFDTQINSYNTDTGAINTGFSENGYYIETTDFNQIPFSLYIENDFFIITGRNQYTDISFEHFSTRYITTPDATASVMYYNNIITFKNPIENILTINSLSQEITNLKIFNIGGKLLRESNANSINTGSLIPGLYILNCYLDNGKIISEKIIKN